MNAADAAVLVVDDNEDNRYTLTRRLKREGYTQLTTANDGRQALDLMRSQQFDLVLLDIMMPELNGYQVLEEVKADAKLRDVPVIMISAVDEIESVVRCIGLGAEDYLPKPFNATLLRARVGATLEKKKLRDEVRASLSRLEQELSAARALQLAMLPRDFPAKSDAIQLSAFIEPAREVGGDLYDFFWIAPTRLCFLVGDVSGKGAPAAMFMARTRSLVRMATELCARFAQDECTPGSVAQSVNRELCQNNADRMFVTLFLGYLDTDSGRVTYVNAGHPPPYVINGKGELGRLAQKPQLPLGVRSAAKYQMESAILEPGQTVFVCSDGVAEAENIEHALYGDERLQAELLKHAGAHPQALVAGIHNALEAFAANAPRADDITMLALRRAPA